MFRLSSQQYAGVVASLRSSSASGGNDKRRFTRMDVQAPVPLGLIANNKITRCFTALSRDISMTGIGLCQGVRLSSDETFLLALPLPRQQIVVICRATFCRPLAEGIYCVGAAFEAEADAANSDAFRRLAATVSQAHPVIEQIPDGPPSIAV
jgi:hypothetical protein